MSIKQQHRVVKFWQMSSRSTGFMTAIHQQVISTNNYKRHILRHTKGGYTLVTLLCTVTPYHDSVDGTHDRVMYQKLVMW